MEDVGNGVLFFFDFFRFRWFATFFPGRSENDVLYYNCRKAKSTYSKDLVTGGDVSSILTEAAKYSSVVQMVNTPACHAGDRGFKSRRSCHTASWFNGKNATLIKTCFVYDSVRQLADGRIVAPQVVGSNPIRAAKSFLRPKAKMFIFQTEDASPNGAGSSK